MKIIQKGIPTLSNDIVTEIQVLQANKKIIRNSRLRMIKNLLKEVIKDLEIIHEELRILKHQTEYWENGAPCNFIKNSWDAIRILLPKISKHLNIIYCIKHELEEKEGKETNHNDQI